MSSFTAVKAVRTIQLKTVGIATATFVFEVRELSVTWQTRSESFELVDGELVDELVWIRPVFQFSTPYLRGGATGNPELISALKNYLEGETLQLSIPAISTGDIEVVWQNKTPIARVERQIVQSSADFTFAKKTPYTTAASVPSWANYTKPTPGYLL